MIFQDFARYQMLVGENIGAGDVRAFEDEGRWRSAAAQGWPRNSSRRCRRVIAPSSASGSRTARAVGRPVAEDRARPRLHAQRADILVLDEPTAAIDAAAEAEVFEHFRELPANRIAIVISHRFSTVRMADQILVLDGRPYRGARQPRSADGARRPLCQAFHSAGARVSLAGCRKDVRMPSFDVVSEIDTHELTNAVDQASRELGQRFDFKGTGAALRARGNDGDHDGALGISAEPDAGDLEARGREARYRRGVSGRAGSRGESGASRSSW